MRGVEQALATVFEAIVEEPRDDRRMRDIGNRQQQLAPGCQQCPQPREQARSVAQVFEHVGANDEIVARRNAAP